LNVFAGMNIEEYLYNLKFQEITSGVSDKRKKRINVVFLAILATAVVAAVLYLVYTNFIV